MNSKWFCNRLTALRMQQNMTARDMSLSLGQSDSYINKIENQKSYPSMEMFFYICEFLKIKPKDFFDEDQDVPTVITEVNDELKKLSPEQLHHIHLILKDINRTKI
ncbi:MAG: helix-turn-helix domain-containing protein [Lachnospiraceae bacterium]